ncbi:hypothetical protein GBAR_LOCUS18007 [Geodia barretti]|uniref:Uncharacterized protein n=1 Tax=Geodia barretti TaxID=519541 RepID=A0AA35SMG8_GEOBA|nr:hypothetical protein GBAR_LOCUS18007 [Geodia barretti]
MENDGGDTRFFGEGVSERASATFDSQNYPAPTEVSEHGVDPEVRPPDNHPTPVQEQGRAKGAEQRVPEISLTARNRQSSSSQPVTKG